jgi:hypothetical protein
MDKTREERDLRSPKRQTLGTESRPGMSAAHAVGALDKAIWMSIAEFMPIPKDLQVGDKKKHEAAVAEVSVTWQTLLHLRLVSKKLAALLHPVENATLWRRLVLQSFDFSTQPGYNAENYQEEHRLDIPDDEEAEPAKTEPNPQLIAMRGRYHDMPANYLEEDTVRWEALGIYHRPSQYGFLTMLQQRSPEGEWPESEDPFTLFGDLVRLLQLPPGEDMCAGGEGSNETDKYLGAPAEADSSSAFHRFYVMKTLGYVPHFWHWGRGIGMKWKGFIAEPSAFAKPVAEQKSVEKEEEDSEDDEEDDESDDEDEEECDEEDEFSEEDQNFEEDEKFDFPGCTLRDAKRLYRHIRQHCRDYRSVCCNSNSDGYTPVFFVGESKAAPHRWTGYFGLKCWT